MTDQSIQETTTSTKEIIIGIFKGVIAFFVVTLSLFHIFYEAKPPQLKIEQERYKSLVKERDSLHLIKRNLFEKDLISKAEYLDFEKKHFLLYKLRLKSQSNLKLKISKDFSFRGRRSFQFWIFAFGVITALFYFACKSLFDEFSKGSTFKHQLVSISGILISGFWLIHLIFLTQDDFQKHNYVILILLCALLFTVFTFYFVKHYSYKDHIIYSQLSFIMRVRTVHLFDLSLRTKYAEKYNREMPSGKRTSDILDEFQNDLRKTTINI